MLKGLSTELLDNFKTAAIRALVLVQWHKTLPLSQKINVLILQASLALVASSAGDLIGTTATFIDKPGGSGFQVV